MNKSKNDNLFIASQQNFTNLLLQRLDLLQNPDNLLDVELGLCIICWEAVNASYFSHLFQQKSKQKFKFDSLLFDQSELNPRCKLPIMIQNSEIQINDFVWLPFIAKDA